MGKGYVLVPFFIVLVTGLANTSDYIPFDLWMNLAYQVTDHRTGNSTSECIQSIDRIVEHIKNATFQKDILEVLDNTSVLIL